MYARTILAVSLAAAAAGAQAADRWQTSGDIRSGYVASESRARSGATTDADSFRTRARFRVRGELGAGWHASGRVAGRLDTNQSDEEFWLRGRVAEIEAEPEREAALVGRRGGAELSPSMKLYEILLIEVGWSIWKGGRPLRRIWRADGSDSG